MIVPSLLSRVEQWHAAPVPWVQAIGLCPFVLVTEFTGKTEIVVGIGPDPDHRSHMIDLESPHDVVLMAEAVLAPVMGALSYTMTRGLWNVRHAGSGSLRPL